jgi:hypothetical protein
VDSGIGFSAKQFVPLRDCFSSLTALLLNQPQAPSQAVMDGYRNRLDHTINEVDTLLVFF